MLVAHSFDNGEFGMAEMLAMIAVCSFFSTCSNCSRRGRFTNSFISCIVAGLRDASSEDVKWAYMHVGLQAQSAHDAHVR